MTSKAILGVFKAQDSDKGIVIEGWANKAVVDRGGDIIPKGAWDLKNYEKNPIILFNHDKSQPIGRAIVTEARDEGLYVKARISQSASPDIAKVRDLIKEGVVNAFSVGFDMQSAEKNADGFNEIKQAELFEISVVAIPMNQDSVFSLAKSYDYDSLKTLCTKGKPADAATDEASEVAEEPEAEAEGKASEDAAPSDDATEVAEEDKPLTPSIQIAIYAVNISKMDFESVEEAAAAVKAAGWAVETVEETEISWFFVQRPQDDFMQFADSFTADIGENSAITLGILKDKSEPEDEGGEAEGPEVEIEIEDGKEKSVTTPMPSDNPQVPDSEDLNQAKQTNVLLGVVITELQKVSGAIAALAQAMPPKAAPEPVKVEDAKPMAEVADDTEVVREYLQAIRKTLDRLGA